MPWKRERPQATCHPERPHCARGLCKRCYEQEKRKGTLADVLRAQCHPERPHWGRGLCSQCYEKVNREENVDKCKARQLRYRERHPGRQKEIARQYRKVHPERCRESSKRWRDANHQKVLEASRKWRNKNREKVRAWGSRRWANKRKSFTNATGQDRAWRVILFGNQCAYCGGAYKHMDHLVALNKGGGDYAGNLVTACVRCNESKRDLDWHEWYRSRPWYDKRMERFIERNTW